MSAAKLLVKQRRAEIGRPQHQRLVLRGLGLRGPGSSVVVDNARAMRGMIRKVLHLVDVAEVDASEVEASRPAASASTGKKTKGAKS